MADNTDTIDCNSAYQVVSDVIDYLVDVAGEVLYDNYVAAKVRAVALDHIMAEVASALRCVNLPHDVGERGIAWAPDEDPECAPIDTWGRGAVPSKKTTKKSSLADMRGGADDEKSVGTRTRGSRRSGRRRAGDPDPQQQRAPAIILTASSSPPPGPRPSTLLNKTAGLMTAQSAEVNELEILQKREQERIEQLRKEQEEENSRYEALQEELKGKEYTFDADGNLIVIARLSAEKTGGLGHLSALDRFGVLDSGGPPPDPNSVPAAALDAEAAAAAAAASPRITGRRASSSPGSLRSTTNNNTKTKTKQRARGGGDGGATHFVADPAKQPPLLTTIRLVPGVTAKEGTSTRAGPPKVDDSLHMSRKDFVAQHDRLEWAESPGWLVGGTTVVVAAEEAAASVLVVLVVLVVAAAVSLSSRAWLGFGLVCSFGWCAVDRLCGGGRVGGGPKLPCRHRYRQDIAVSVQRRPRVCRAADVGCVCARVLWQGRTTQRIS
jgi:hypothetical protein